MTKDEALKLALEALEFIPKSGSMLGTHAEAKRLEAITAIKAALAQPEQEPWLLESTQTLAKTLAREFYPEVTQWKCLNDLAGVISQIDNMTTGLMRKPEQEPVVFINVEQRKLEWAKYMSWDTPTIVNLPKIPLYTTPPQRTWVGLTDDEISEVFGDDIHAEQSGELRFIRAIEAKLKEKNT